MGMLVYFICIVLLSATVYFAPRKYLQYLCAVLFVILQLAFNTFIILRPELFTWEFFRPDALSLIFISILTITGIITVINSFVYFEKRNELPGRRSIYLASLYLLFMCIAGVFLSDNINVLWIFAEATTLCISLLIYHERTAEALEATWKYFFVSTIGLSLSFIGILLLNAATNVTGFSSLTFSSLTAREVLITNELIFQISFMLIVIGFSVKMGVFPLHTVCIDAHSVAPGPVSAIISTSLMNAGFVAVFRFAGIFARTGLGPWISHVLLIIGILSVLVATIYILRVDNYKRLIAYSSIEHMGLVSIGIAAGGIATYAVILHLVIHSLTKAGLFCQSSQWLRIYKSKHVQDTGGYYKISVSGGLLVLLLFLIIMGIPPSGLFFTKFLILSALASSGYLWLMIIILILLAFILWAFGKNILHILFSPLPEKDSEPPCTISPWENTPQYALLLLALYIGLNPPVFLTDTIQQAIQMLPK